MPPAKPTAPPPPAIADILAGLDQLTDKFAPENTALRDWMAARSSNPRARAYLSDATPLTLRVLAAIGQWQPVNGATISKETRTPKGSVSKIARRLIADGLAVQEALPNNKKEVLFRLTPLGRELNDLHQQFDAQMQRGLVQFFESYHPDELLFMLRLLSDLQAADFLALGNQRAKRS